MQPEFIAVPKGAKTARRSRFSTVQSRFHPVLIGASQELVAVFAADCLSNLALRCETKS
jgi:hypothetical protein